MTGGSTFMQPVTKAYFVIALAGILSAGAACAQAPTETAQASPPVVRIAELEIDPAQVDAYKAALTEEVEASVRLEPGVLALNAVSINDNPAHIRLLEIYASQSAYESHLKSPHFVRYKVSTEKMVKSLRLISTAPVKLCAKSGFAQGGAASCM
jgi:quinol monooxygenase YgiN